MRGQSDPRYGTDYSTKDKLSESGKGVEYCICFVLFFYYMGGSLIVLTHAQEHVGPGAGGVGAVGAG